MPFKANIDLIAGGENVSAKVANRPLSDLQGNIEFVKDQLDGISQGKALIVKSQVVVSSTVVGSPVFWNALNSRFELAQAIDAKSAVVGVVRDKPYSSTSLADITLHGEDSIDISGALEGAESLAAARYFLSAATAGKLTASRPASFQQSVLITDGSGKVWVLPQDKDIVGAAGPQGSQGDAGVQGPQGVQGTAGGENSRGKTITAASYTVDVSTDTILLADAASNQISIDLPPASTSNEAIVRVVKIDSSANTVIIDANGTELINGQLTVTLVDQHTAITLWCNGSAWYLI